MLTHEVIEHILRQLPSLTLGIVGDLFLDRYLDLDASLTEPSIETGLDAYQVVRVRSYPGAAGTVINNLLALGVGKINILSVIGDDGEGYELRQALGKHPPADLSRLLTDASIRTPTYTKPMLQEQGKPARELNRIDIKNRKRLPEATEARLIDVLPDVWNESQVLLVLDQVSEPDCGVVTSRVRKRLAELGDRDNEKIVLADSRERIGMFRSTWLKPNHRECLGALGQELPVAKLLDAVRLLARRCGRPVFCTHGAEGIYIADPRSQPLYSERVGCFSVAGPIDIVGAGDSCNAGIACAMASGASLAEAAAFGNLVASITIRQIGVTGTATPEQVQARWREIGG